MNRALVGLALTVITVWGCNETDSVAPQVSLEEVAPLPVADSICGTLEQRVVVLSAGDTLNVHLSISDNIELGELKVDIHPNFDCHGHSGKTATTDWEVLEIRQLSGDHAHLTLKYLAPGDVTPGAYHFDLQVADKAGNQAETAELFDLKCQ